MRVTQCVNCRKNMFNASGSRCSDCFTSTIAGLATERTVCGICKEPLTGHPQFCSPPLPTTGLAQVPPHDWPTFWQSLTPEEVAAALRAAPRVAEAWAETRDGDTARISLGHWPASVVKPYGREYGCVINYEWGRWPSKGEALRGVDEKLRAAGWVLL